MNSNKIDRYIPLKNLRLVKDEYGEGMSCDGIDCNECPIFFRNFFKLIDRKENDFLPSCAERYLFFKNYLKEKVLKEIESL